MNEGNFQKFIKLRGTWYTAGGLALLVPALLVPSHVVKFAFLWCALVCFYIGLGYFFSFTRLLFKNDRGIIPWPVKIALLPFFAGTYFCNWISRQTSDDPAFQEISTGLFIGRRILPADLGDLETHGINAVLDVTAEFDALSLTVEDTPIEYLNVPIFDHSVPKLRHLHKAVAQIDKWRSDNKTVLVHCALGRGRSAMALLAYLIYRKPDTTTRELLEAAQAIRGSIAPNFRQLRMLEKYRNSKFVTERKPRAYVIINPTAGSYGGDGMRDEIKRQLEPFFDVSMQFTTPEHGAEAIAKEAIARNIDLVVACGGDGTVSAVASTLVHTDTTLGILPLGTANALANCLYGTGNTSDLATNCERIAKQSTRIIDTAECNGHALILLSGIGLESGMISRASPDIKQRWGVLAYVAGAIQEFTELDTLELTLTVDGNAKKISTYSLIVANAAPAFSILAQGGGEPVYDDGELDITWLESKGDAGESVVSMVELVQSGLLDNPETNYVHHEKGRVIEFTANKTIPVVIDGELFEFDHIEIRCIPQSLRVIA